VPKVKINADGVGYCLPNPDPTLPPILAAAYRGEVVDMPSAEVERLRKVRVRVFYTDPLTGQAGGAFREEPSVVDANEAEAAGAEAAEAARERVRRLEDELAQARADLPLGTSAAPRPRVHASSAEARELPAFDVPLVDAGAGDDAGITTPAKPAKVTAPKPPPAPPGS